MNIAIIKYNAGNIYSVDYALKRLGVEAVITSDKEKLMKADKKIGRAHVWTPVTDGYTLSLHDALPIL